ncbi:uncharacterized protein F4817DRAFT_355886 [Daldinia loculata]|uniref:uncharacterized protein n=1 Tax=Daldinia loculata TaxID=103429 RepID=UPI0020C50711|nr:uncharacterized protein F4817DRAFT_355886 [Daldinia loculata]KAI1651944.1 hypothetical protein F4817DRAFT_355886 [Daldinia loculata]
MAHSPLLRTLARFTLDIRSVALVKYELALEDVSTNLQLPPDKTNFDETRWSDLRKDYESKKTRESKKKLCEQELTMMIMRECKLLYMNERRSQHYNNLLQIGEEVIPTNAQALRATLLRSGLPEWKPPVASECLLFESPPIPCTYGQVCAAETGILDRRLLHHYLTPKYVPKPHFKMERRRLEAKSAEFAAFVEKQTSDPNKPSLIPRPQDESSDEGLLTVDESEEDAPVKNAKGSRAKLGKRKPAVKNKTKKRTRKPATFVKLYDCKAHDYAQLKSQGVNLYSLLVQRLPRAESPAMEQVSTATVNYKIKSPMPVLDDDELWAEELRIHGCALPIQLPRNDAAEEEQESPTFEDAQEYRIWRNQTKPFFSERDRYMQSRIYREGVRDNKLLHATQELVAFWAKITA